MWLSRNIKIDELRREWNETNTASVGEGSNSTGFCLSIKRFLFWGGREYDRGRTYHSVERAIRRGTKSYPEHFSVLPKGMIRYLSCPATEIRVFILFYSRVVMQLGICVFASYVVLEDSSSIFAWQGPYTSVQFAEQGLIILHSFKSFQEESKL